MFAVLAEDSMRQWISGVFDCRESAEAYLAQIPDAKRSKHSVTDLGGLTYPLYVCEDDKKVRFLTQADAVAELEKYAGACAEMTKAGAIRICTGSRANGGLSDLGPTTWAPCLTTMSQTSRLNAPNRMGSSRFGGDNTRQGLQGATLAGATRAGVEVALSMAGGRPSW
jgi:hypothetical protein